MQEGLSAHNQLEIVAEQEARAAVVPREQLICRPIVRGIAIDAPGSNDKEQSYWLQRTPNQDEYVLTISVVDPSTLIQRGSAMEQMAIRRLMTNYDDGDSVKWMLPELISTELLSLKRGGDIATLSLNVGYNARTREVSLIDVVPTVTHVEDDIDYADFESLLSHGGRLGDVDVSDWQKIGVSLRKRRRTRGDYLGENHKDNYENQYPKAAGLVKELSVLTQEVMAEYCLRAGVPILYRNNIKTVPNFRTDGRIKKKPIDMMTDDVWEGMLFGEPYYDVNPFAHSGIKCPYAPFTAPLRDISCFMNFQNLMAHLEGREIVYEEDELLRAGQHVVEEQAYRKWKAQERIQTPTLVRVERSREELETTLIEAFSSWQVDGTNEEKKRIFDTMCEEAVDAGFSLGFEFEVDEEESTMVEALAPIASPLTHQRVWVHVHHPVMKLTPYSKVTDDDEKCFTTSTQYYGGSISLGQGKSTFFTRVGVKRVKKIWLEELEKD